ncbi:MAG: phytoene/squalene synthase family protein [Verrucomicrobiota bacterium]
MSQSDLLTSLLKEVSRSFYLTLRVLPQSVRRQIGLAYLLARASDTIADTDAASQEHRLALLQAFRERICSVKEQRLNLEQLSGEGTSAAERALLHRIEEALRVLGEFDFNDQECIRTVLETIISGQELDVRRFAKADAKQIASLNTAAELDDYTYRVAGCVGVFWTRICRRHLFPRADLDDAFLLANGVRFGKGLQMVNILRDIPADLRLGRCYLPSDDLRTQDLTPSDLLHPANEARLRGIYERYLSIAAGHLEAGWQYTTHLPRKSVRVRLACAWPILIGARTLAKLAQGGFLDPAKRIKVSRKEVRAVMLQSVALYPWRERWNGLLHAYKVPNHLLHQPSLAK